MKNIFFALMFVSASVLAESWMIGDTLEVDSGELDVTFQIFPDFDPEANMVHGWRGEDLHYLVLVDHQPGGRKSQVYWNGILKEIKQGADGQVLKIHSEGFYLSASGSDITYKVLSWLSEGETTTQMYNLVIGNKDSYWVIATPISEDVDYMVGQTKKLLSTAVIKH